MNEKTRNCLTNKKCHFTINKAYKLPYCQTKIRRRENNARLQKEDR